jgi:hypothetical protein
MTQLGWIIWHPVVFSRAPLRLIEFD